MSIKISKLISISMQLAQEGCQIVKDSYLNKQVKTFQKAEDDPVTEADFKIQTMIINGLKQHYPQINIIGEEEVEFKGQINVNYEKISQEILPSSMDLNRTCNAEDLCIWIDPIDCTKGFVGGYVEDVTILIGISEKRKAQFGVIGMPFKRIQEKLIYQPSVVFGSATEKMVYEWNFKEEKDNQWIKLSNNVNPNLTRVVISKNRGTQQQQSLIKDLEGQLLLCGGSGKKIMMIAKNQAEMMIYMKPFAYKWDSCAGEAVVRAMGGYFGTPYGQQLTYNPLDKTYANLDGFFCTFNKQIQQKVISICKKKRESEVI